ncbi:MAG TPA: transcription elongation factor GreAB [Opitutae bacterium]|nr:transcription elongation factor GreAB [Opitutaceae bacterium]HCR31289.1 transcription elongation factor GreAB [Opitutae bacterium]
MNEEAVLELITRKPELKPAKEKLESMHPGSYCIHQSWGFGQIKEYDEESGKLIIDFEGKEGHRMDPGFCVVTMQVLPPDHLMARKETEPEAIAELVSKNQGNLIVELLKQYPNGAASAVEVESILNQVVGADTFKKWWTATKKILAKDPRIAVPPRKTGMYVLREEPVSIEEELIEEYNETQSAKRRVLIADKLLDTVREKPEIEDKLAVVLHGLTTAVKESNQLSLAEKLRGAWIRNDLAEILEVDIADFEPTLLELVREPDTLDTLVKDLPTTLQTRALELIKESHPADWKEISFNLLKNSSGKFTTDCVNFLLQNGFDKELLETFERWQTEQNLKEPVLLWIVKNRNSRKFGNLVRPMITPRLLNAIFYAIDYEALQISTTRRIPLAEVLSEDTELIPDLLADADSETARDLANNLLLNQGFEELTKKSLLARFIKIFPAVQSLLETGEESKASGLIVSKESYDKAVAEYDDLVTKQIPENSKAIGLARELGDLKENSEYKMAKQDQSLLLARRNKLEMDLQKAKISDFSEIGTEAVGIGSVVTLLDENKNKEITYTILGAWDSDPDKQIISYRTPLGKALLGKTPGDEIELHIEGVDSLLKVVSIERYVDLVAS